MARTLGKGRVLAPIPNVLQLVSCEAKRGSLSNQGITRPWGLKHSMSLETKQRGQPGPRVSLKRMLTPLQPWGPAQNT